MTSRFLSMGELRKFAETRIDQAQPAGLRQADTASLIYELDVHHEELKIQNEELRRTQAQLQYAIECYTDLFDFAPVGYLTIDADGVIAAANLTAATMLGRERSRIVGTRLALYVSNESKRALASSLDHVLMTGSRDTCEIIIHRAEGDLHVQLDLNRSASAKDASAKDASVKDGSTLGTIANDSGMHCRLTMTDVSELRRVQRIATEKDNRLRALADALPVFICYLDQDLLVQYCNPEASGWLGNPTERQLECRVGDLLGDSANEISDYLADAIRGHRVDFEMRLSNTTEQERLVQFMLVPDRNLAANVVGVHVLGIDITEQSKIRQQESRRRQFEEKLAKLTQGEKDVYELLIRGKSNKSIAFDLDLGLRTAERRRKTIFDKLNVESLGELLQDLGAIQGIGRK